MFLDHILIPSSFIIGSHLVSGISFLMLILMLTLCKTDNFYIFQVSFHFIFIFTLIFLVSPSLSVF